MRGLFTSEGGRACVFPGQRPGYPARCVLVPCTLGSVCVCVCTLGSVCVVCVCVCVCVCPNAPRQGLYNQRTVPPNERDHRNKRRSERNGPVHSHKGLGILSRVVPFPPAGGRQALALPGVSQDRSHVTAVFVPHPKPAPSATGWGEISKIPPGFPGGRGEVATPGSITPVGLATK